MDGGYIIGHNFKIQSTWLCEQWCHHAPHDEFVVVEPIDDVSVLLRRGRGVCAGMLVRGCVCRDARA